MPRSLVLILSILHLTACSPVTYSAGIEPDNLSGVTLGTSRNKIEKLLDSPIHTEICTSGSKAFYVYDRGIPPHDDPALAALVWVLLDVASLGMQELFSVCHGLCQRGILEVLYDEELEVAAIMPRPKAYDVGTWCGARDEDVPVGDYVRLSGKVADYCELFRNAAAKSDLAKPVGDFEKALTNLDCD